MRLICRGPTSSVVAIFEAFRQRVDFRPISLEAAVGVVVGGRRATQKRWDLDLRLAPTSPKSIQGEECDGRRRAGQCQVNPGDQGRSSLASPVAQASRSGSGGSPVFRSHATSSVGHLNRFDGCGSRKKAGTSKISGLLSLESVIATPEMCIGHPRKKPLNRSSSGVSRSKANHHSLAFNAALVSSKMSRVWLGGTLAFRKPSSSLLRKSFDRTDWYEMPL